MNGITRDNAFFLVIIVAAGIQVAVEAWEIAARDFDAQLVSDSKVVADSRFPGE